MDKLSSLQAFKEVVNRGSFRKAAEVLEVSPAMVSKYLARLEQELGTRLLTRTTRSVRLTEEGERYFGQVKPLLDELEAAELEISAGTNAPKGELRITAPIDLGNKILPSIICEYQRAYPDVNVSLILSDRQVDMFEENFDLALRVGRVRDENLIARKFTKMPMVLCASPIYWAANKPLEHPSELINHNCLFSTDVAENQLWFFREGGRSFRQRVKSRLRINSLNALAQAAIEGMGIVYLPKDVVEVALKDGLLEERLNAYIEPPLSVFFVYPERNYLPAKVRTFIDILLSHF